MTYRRDIDGLRALAILSVLLFHLDVSFLSGGFVGVDIFFVISGYLITKMLLRDMRKGNFSFAYFYIKRIRRIFPALFVMFAILITVALLLLLPAELRWFAKTMKYASLQMSNFLFQRHFGYFHPSADEMPLLHTWSLGIEEQFYLVWPLLLIWLLKVKKYQSAPFYGLLIISIISLVLSEYQMEEGKQKLAFFSLQSRLWELGVGGLLSFDKVKNSKSKILNELCGWLGLFLILISFSAMQQRYFPGVTAIMPCVGAALVIYSGSGGESSNVSRILSTRIFVYIGLISYSLYLWHWPIITFYKLFTGETNFSTVTKTLIILFSIAISYLSYRYVETPFRKRKTLKEEVIFKLNIGKSGINLYLPIICGVFTIISFFFISKILMSFELPRRVINGSNYNTENSLTTGLSDKRPLKNLNDVRKPEVLLFGDSHAEHYAPVVKRWAERRNLRVLNVTGYGCPPLFGTKTQAKRSCDNSHNSIKEVIEKNRNNIKYIFIGARWSAYVNGDFQDLLNDSDSKEAWSSEENAKRVFVSSLRKTINFVKNKKIVLLGEVPSTSSNILINAAIRREKLYLLKNLFGSFGGDKSPISKRVEHDAKVGFTKQSLEAIAQERSGVEYFDPTKYLCDKKLCFYKLEGKMLYGDGNHINSKGSGYLGRFFDVNF